MKSRPDPDGYLIAELSRTARGDTAQGRQGRIADAQARFQQAQLYCWVAGAVIMLVSAVLGLVCVQREALWALMPVGGVAVIGLIWLSHMHKSAYVDLMMAQGHDKAQARRMWDDKYGVS